MQLDCHCQLAPGDRVACYTPASECQGTGFRFKLFKMNDRDMCLIANAMQADAAALAL